MPKWIHDRAEHLLAKNPSMSKSMAFAVATQQAHSTGHTPKGYGTSEGKSTAKAKFDTPKDDEQSANPGKLESSKMAAEERKFSLPQHHEPAMRVTKGGSSCANCAFASVQEDGPRCTSPEYQAWMGTSELIDPKTGERVLEADEYCSDWWMPAEAKEEAKVGHAIVQVVKQAGLMQRLPQAVRSIPSTVKNVVTGAGERNMHMNEVAGLGVLAVPGLDTLQSKLRARLAGDTSHHGAEKRQLLGEGAHAALDVGGLGILAAPALSHLRKHAFANSGYAGNVAQNGPGMKSHSQLPAFKPAQLQVKVSKVSPLKRVGELVTGSKAGRLREAALRHADRAADGKLPRELKAARKLRGLAKSEENRVGKTQGALVGSAALGTVSDTTGLVEKVRDHKKEAGVGVGAGMTTSQYSGPLSYGPFKMTSGIPPFKRPAMTKGDESLEGAAWMYGGNKEASFSPQDAHWLAGALEREADDVDANPNKYRKRRALLGGVLGTGAGALLGNLKKHPGLGAAVGGVLGAAALGLPKPSSQPARDEATYIRARYGEKEASAASTGAMSPAAKLTSAQRIAGPKTTGFTGPSIADIAKPKGFGQPMPGAQKNQI